MKRINQLTATTKMHHHRVMFLQRKRTKSDLWLRQMDRSGTQREARSGSKQRHSKDNKTAEVSLCQPDCMFQMTDGSDRMDQMDINVNQRTVVSNFDPYPEGSKYASYSSDTSQTGLFQTASLVNMCCVPPSCPQLGEH